MLKYVRGNIFCSECEVLVNPVNCVGVMGKGLALEFKQKYPDMFKSYQEVCKTKALRLGCPMFVKGADKSIVLFPTKYHWKEKSKIEAVKEGLEVFVRGHKKLGIKSVAFPKLGCGLGGLDWEEVRPIMEYYLSNLDIEVEIYI